MMKETKTGLVLLAGVLLIGGCSAPSQLPEADGPSAAEKESERAQPDWYRTDFSLERAGGDFQVQAAALGSDSVSAAEKAVRIARLRLESEMSSQLEEIRRSAVGDGGGERLDNPDFIQVLRNAESLLGESASRDRIEVMITGFAPSRRAFAQLRLSREKVIALLEAELSAHETAWNAFRSSAAFSRW